MPSPLRIVFAGTPEFSVAPLAALLGSEHQVVAVYTQPDRPAGRGQKLTASPVKALALAHNLPVYQPLSLRTPEAQAELAALQADVMVVVAYGLILPQAVLGIPTFGCLNIHASLLPRWRGAAPIQRAIEAGDVQTGITIMQMDVGLDTGDMLYKLQTTIEAVDTAQTVHDRLMQMGAQALLDTLHQLPHLQNQAQKQNEADATYAHKLHKEEAKLDWQRPALELWRKIQAFNPWPVAFCDFQEHPLRIWQARLAKPNESFGDATAAPGTILKVDKSGIWVQTADQALCLQQVQAAGKKMINAYDFAQSRHLTGQVFK
ncbi:MAG: methionyl-tRNA formyltransferase [Thiotrichales bacterium]|nr:methionyl-tRNA formyltransferase [Thiotrichales bacterium]